MLASLIALGGCAGSGEGFWPSITPTPRGAAPPPRPFLSLLPENLWELLGGLGLLAAGGGVGLFLWKFPDLLEEFTGLRQMAERLHERRDSSTADLAQLSRRLTELEQQMIQLRRAGQRRAYPQGGVRSPVSISHRFDPHETASASAAPAKPLPPEARIERGREPQVAVETVADPFPTAPPLNSGRSSLVDSGVGIAPAAVVAPPPVVEPAGLAEPPGLAAPPGLAEPPGVVVESPGLAEPSGLGGTGAVAGAGILQEPELDLAPDLSSDDIVSEGSASLALALSREAEVVAAPSLDKLIAAINGDSGGPIEGVTCVEVDIATPDESGDTATPNATRLRLVAGGGRFLLVLLDGDPWLFPTVDTLANFRTDQPDQGIFHYLPDSCASPRLITPAMLREVGGLWEVSDLGEILVPTA